MLNFFSFFFFQVYFQNDLLIKALNNILCMDYFDNEAERRLIEKWKENMKLELFIHFWWTFLKMVSNAQV